MLDNKPDVKLAYMQPRAKCRCCRRGSVMTNGKAEATNTAGRLHFSVVKFCECLKGLTAAQATRKLTAEPYYCYYSEVSGI
jgi:hypothetical protein